MTQHPDGVGMTVVDDPRLHPVCPHCEQAVTTISARELASQGPFGFGKRYVYACPHCRKILGVSHRKGFWMG